MNNNEIKHKILVSSGKGGVGKSSVSVCVAISLAKRGYKVGLLDIDLCGPSIPLLLGLDDDSSDHNSNNVIFHDGLGWNPIVVPQLPNLSVVSIAFLLPRSKLSSAIIWRGPKKSTMIRQFMEEVHWGRLDFLIIDSPPGTSDEHISIIKYNTTAATATAGLAVDRVCTLNALIVSTSQEVALADVRKQIQLFKHSHVNIIGLIENMSGYSCPHCTHCTNIFASEGAKNTAEELSFAFLGKIPIDSRLQLSSSNELLSCNSFNDALHEHFDEIINKILAIFKG